MTTLGDFVYESAMETNNFFSKIVCNPCAEGGAPMTTDKMTDSSVANCRDPSESVDRQRSSHAHPLPVTANSNSKNNKKEVSKNPAKSTDPEETRDKNIVIDVEEITTQMAHTSHHLRERCEQVEEEKKRIQTENQALRSLANVGKRQSNRHSEMSDQQAKEIQEQKEKLAKQLELINEQKGEILQLRIDSLKKKQELEEKSKESQEKLKKLQEELKKHQEETRELENQIELERNESKRAIRTLKRQQKKVVKVLDGHGVFSWSGDVDIDDTESLASTKYTPTTKHAKKPASVPLKTTKEEVGDLSEDEVSKAEEKREEPPKKDLLDTIFSWTVGG